VTKRQIATIVKAESEYDKAVDAYLEKPVDGEHDARWLASISLWANAIALG